VLRVEVFNHASGRYSDRRDGPSVGFLVADGDNVWAEPADDRHLRKVLRHGMPPRRGPVKNEADLRLLVERGEAMPYYGVREVTEPEPTVTVVVSGDGGDPDPDFDDDLDECGLTREEILARLDSPYQPEAWAEVEREERRRAEEEGIGE
jgi:hypothetical protein